MQIGLENLDVNTLGFKGLKSMFGSKIELISILLSSNFISSSPRASYTGFNENIVELYGITIMQLLPTKCFCKTN